MSNIKIDIKDLANPCSTRARAKEAVEKLNKIIRDNSVIIDLTSVNSISLSFLDELIFWISTMANMRKVTFLTNNETIQNKLSRVADIRKTELIKYQLSNGQIKEISPRTIEPIHAKFVAKKVSV